MSLVVYLNSLGPSELVYPVIAVALVAASFAFLTRPFVNLALALSYLVVANNAIYVLGLYWSAFVAALLISNCSIGALLTTSLNRTLLIKLLKPALLVGSIGALGAAYGFARGNPTDFVVGDFYHILEFAALFALSRMLVRTESQLRTLVLVIIVAAIFTSLLQTVDAFMEAPYLPQMEGLHTKRIINMFAPIAFVLLLAAFPSTRWRTWDFAGLIVVESYIILSFARGLWLAAAVSALFLSVVLPAQLRRPVFVLSSVCVALAAILIFAFDLGSLVTNRINFGIEQLSTIPAAPPPAASPPGANRSRKLSDVPAPSLGENPDSPGNSISDPPLASRRVLEHVLLLHEIADRPLLGHGLGATYAIAGSAVMGGPKGEQVSFHFVHDFSLAIAFRLGLPGLAIFASMLWLYFRQTLRNLRSASLSCETAALLAGLAAAVFGQAVLSLTSPVFINHPTGGVIGSMMAITLTRFKSATRGNTGQAVDDRPRA